MIAMLQLSLQFSWMEVSCCWRHHNLVTGQQGSAACLHFCLRPQRNVANNRCALTVIFYRSFLTCCLKRSI